MWLILSITLACHPSTTADGEQCLSCHVGIEQAHASIEPGQCTVCHGGDGSATEKELAHVPVPTDWAEIRGDALPPAPDGYIRDMAADQLSSLDPDYVRFVNPGDLRVLDQSCGTCHPDISATTPTSVMSTNAGHYMPTLYYAGYQDQNAIYGALDIVDPDCDGSVEGAVCSLTTLTPASAEELDAALAADDMDELEHLAYDDYLAKSCNRCHGATFGKNNATNLYRSSGCSACHVLYASDGVYQGNDAAIQQGVPVYPARHEITSAIPTEQCASCHYQGGRIGLTFRGIREGGFSETPKNAEPWAESVYGHVAGYYLLDEDTTNDVDETPPDLHYAAGMDCADCHIGTNVHGDGNLYSTARGQLDIACQDCHGDNRQRATPDAVGVFRTSGGRALPQLSLKDDGSVVLTSRVDGKEHIVTQPADLLAEGGGGTEAMHAAMGINDSDWSHPDSLTCDTCHNSWQLYCIGCHVSVDLRLSQTDFQTGQSTPGMVRGTRDTWSLDHMLLSQAPSGKAQATNPSQHVQMAVIDSKGQVRVGSQDKKGNIVGAWRSNDITDTQSGFSPFFQHTTSAIPRTCKTCHRVDDTDAEWARVRGVYGYGTGEFMLDNPDGDPVDVLKFLNDDGSQAAAFSHIGTGPLAADVIDRALGVTVADQ